MTPDDIKILENQQMAAAIAADNLRDRLQRLRKARKVMPEGATPDSELEATEQAYKRSQRHLDYARNQLSRAMAQIKKEGYK